MKQVATWRLAPWLAGLGCFGVVTAQAQSGAATDTQFSFSGFATLGLVKTNTDAAKYVISGQPRGATTSISADVDSKLGVQGTAKFTPMFSATAQLLAKQNGDGNFTPALEWAFVKAQINPSLTARVGRMGGPFFAVSDFRDVGYANTWLRPPQDVYGQVPVGHYDGADLSYQFALGGANTTVQVFGGKSSAVFEGIDVHMKSVVGLNATAEFDNGLTLRLGRVQGKLTVDSSSLNGLVKLLRTVKFNSVADQLDATSKDASFTGLGLNWDQGDWLAQFEYTMRRTSSYVPDTDGWYFTLGHRVGKFTPYLTVSQLKQTDSNVNNVIPAGVALPSPPFPFPVPDLKRLIDGTLHEQSNRQKTVAVGVRWDVYRNMALKAQYDQISPDGPGLFSAPAATFGQSKVRVYSVSLDLVF